MPTTTTSILFSPTTTTTTNPRIISDIQLQSQCPILPPNPQLHFLSYIDPALLPLYLAAGPSLDIWTDNDDTERWFEEILLYGEGNDNEEEGDKDGDGDGDESKVWWSARHAQSRVGILVQVQADGSVVPEEEEEGARGRPRVTEMLIYGSVTAGESGNVGLTPPTEESAGCGVREMRVHALPLSSDLLYRGDGRGDGQGAMTPLSPASDGFESGSPAAYFLPPLFAEPLVTSVSARKRQRVANLLDDAALRHKKARRKGGDAVGRVMGSIEGGSSNQQLPPSRGSASRTISKSENEVAMKSFKEDSQYRRPSLENRHSRSSSVSSLQTTGLGRPPSRKGLLLESKRSSLHRMDSIMTANNDSPVPEQEKTMEQRNKDALSRVVMAGMRLYGLQQKRKTSKSRAPSEVPSQTATQDFMAKGSAEDVDDYKLIYHQTFKGAAFALRREIATSVISQVVMRDVADKLLAIFCSDPSSEVDGALVQGFGQEALGPSVPSRRPVVEPG